jgi:hypothetical protein
MPGGTPRTGSALGQIRQLFCMRVIHNICAVWTLFAHIGNPTCAPRMTPTELSSMSRYVPARLADPVVLFTRNS